MDATGWGVRFSMFLTLVLMTLPTGLRAAGPVPAETIDKIGAAVMEGIDQKTVASIAVGIVKDGNLVLARGYGFADLENDVPATAESVYRLGSITKQFTALAIMQLAEQGKLTVDDELTKFLPDYPTAGHKVTVHQLLNHTSGIKSYTSLKEFFKQARNDFSHDELLAMFKNEPFDFEPGAKWQYNNSGYYLLGMIIEKVSGQKYSAYLEDHIFKPLGMTATRYGHLRPLIRHRAMGYKLMLGQLINDDPMSMDAPGAAGALVSNVLDLIKWHQALESGMLLKSESFEAMYRETKLPDGKTQPYGYGWGLGELAGHRKLSHGGGINGFSTMIARYPSDRLAIVLLSNTAGSNMGALETHIAKLILGIDDKPIVDLPIDEARLKQIAGTYEIEGLKVELTVEEGKLFATLPGQPKDRLKYQGDQKFVSSNNSGIRVTFAPAEGEVQGFEAETDGQKLSGKRVK
jgi:CubicO group peptidase (beta-lactamase class C family)